MDQNTPNNVTKPLTFVDVLRMFRAKTVIIIVCLALLVSAIAGAIGFGLWGSTSSYGSEITFYLSSKDGTHALLPLLNSDSFAEKLLLDENGLPSKSECNEEDYNKALEWTTKYNEALLEKRKSAGIAEELAAQVAQKKAIYESDLAEYTRIYNLLNAYLLAYNNASATGTGVNAESSDKSDLAAMIAKYEVELDNAADTVANSKAEYDATSKSKLANDVTLAQAKNNVIHTRTEMEKALEIVLKPWRQREDIQSKISVIRESVSFKYAKINDAAASTSPDNENAAFLVITVSVLNDEKMADKITKSIISCTPDYVEKNIERITDVNDPDCSLISTFADTQQEDNSDTWIKIALISVASGAVTLVCSCFIVVIYNLLPDDMKRKKKASK